ncbi:hypothetical protein Tco_0191984, partial [Tanacetum coccineum]
FGDFNLSEWDELGVIIKTKKNECVPDMVNSLGKKYDQLKEMTQKLNIDDSLPIPQQDLSLPKLTKRKRKPMKLDPKLYIVGIE